MFLYVCISDEDMQSVASLMSLAQDVGNSEDFDEEEDTHNTSDDMTSKINELTAEIEMLTGKSNDPSAKNPFDDDEDSGKKLKTNCFVLNFFH